ncbi:MAG: L-lactate dehydrogenase, partial [Alicyclobacillus shizuokensis]|nr:L-lactate dehydrogenase [Alicyclobacillus shizuokensis]
PEETKQRIDTQTRDAAYEIIRAKGSTSYAIALALDRICAAILHDERAVLNVSTLLAGYHGISDVYMGVPCVVGRLGVARVVDLPLEDGEVEGLRHSAEELSKRIREVYA